MILKMDLRCGKVKKFYFGGWQNAGLTQSRGATFFVVYCIVADGLTCSHISMTSNGQWKKEKNRGLLKAPKIKAAPASLHQRLDDTSFPRLTKHIFKKKL